MDRLYRPVEIKALSDGTIQGYGSVFDNVDSHGDIVAKGAFADSISESRLNDNWPAMLLQHGKGPSTEDQLPIGIWTHMNEDDHGLYLEGKLAFTQRGRDLYALLKMEPRPAINGLSIGYQAKQFEIHGRANKARRTLQSVKLVEVSLVCNPSNSLATVRRVKSIWRNQKSIPRNVDAAATNFMRALASLDAR
jgi:uncharacterized protein